ncbi:MAG TPA: hypothetical protein VGE18_02635 [Candidatus Paceibacterota bacterium]
MRYIFLLIIIGASIGTFFMVIKPRYDKLQVIKAEVANYDTSLETAEQLQSSREELIAKYNSISKTDLDGVKTLLPDSVDNIRLIIQLDSLATKNGLSTLRSVDYKSEETSSSGTGAGGAGANAGQAQNIAASNKPYGEFTISFQTAGQYKNFLAFLSDLEQNLRLVDITAIDFGASSGGSSSSGTSTGTSSGTGDSVANNLTYKVTLKTYWLKK